MCFAEISSFHVVIPASWIELYFEVIEKNRLSNIGNTRYVCSVYVAGRPIVQLSWKHRYDATMMSFLVSSEERSVLLVRLPPLACVAHGAAMVMSCVGIDTLVLWVPVIN